MEAFINGKRLVNGFNVRIINGLRHDYEVVRNDYLVAIYVWKDGQPFYKIKVKPRGTLLLRRLRVRVSSFKNLYNMTEKDYLFCFGNNWRQVKEIMLKNISNNNQNEFYGK